jgi:WD40 repeat protein
VLVANSAPAGRAWANVAALQHRRSLKLMSLSWTLLGHELSGAQNDDTLGTSVALSSDGTVLAAGASGGNYVRVWAFSGSSWALRQGGVALSGVSSAARLGYCSALSSDGSILAAGAPDTTNGAGTNAGRFVSRDGTSETARADAYLTVRTVTGPLRLHAPTPI